MENSSQKEEYKPEDMLLNNTTYNPCQQEVIDDKDSSSMKSCNDNDNLLQNGRWSSEEHIRFIKGCLLFANNWKKVKKYVRTRSSAQIRSHAQKYLIKLNKKYPSSLQSEMIDKDAVGCDSNSHPAKSKNYNDLEVLTNIINSLNSTNIDMETVERAILARFKFNGNDKPFQSIAIDDLNIKSEFSSSNKETQKKKNEIFSVMKVSKGQREEEKRRLKFNRENNIAEVYSTDDNYQGSVHGQSKERSATIELENFIHSCLNSYDPNDLTRLLAKFSSEPPYRTIPPYGYSTDSNETENYASERNPAFTSELLPGKDNCFAYNQRDYSFADQRKAGQGYENTNASLFRVSNYLNNQRGVFKSQSKDKEGDNNRASAQEGQIEGQYIMGMLNDNTNAHAFNTGTPANNNQEQAYHYMTPPNYTYPFNIISFNRNNNNSTVNTNPTPARHQSAFTQHSTMNESNHLATNLFNHILMRQNADNSSSIFKAYQH